MLDYEHHLDDLLRHLSKVRQNSVLLGKRLIEDGRSEFGRSVIARGMVHDNSKFFGIEWDFLHAGKDAPPAGLKLAVEHHRKVNEHHPEYWGDIQHMPELAVAEMACDLYARSQEFGSGLREWIKETGMGKYGLKETDKQYEWLTGFVDILLTNSFQ